MASSSEALRERQDWIAALSKGHNPSPAQHRTGGDWIEALTNADGFTEGMPFVHTSVQPDRIEPENEDSTAPDPVNSSASDLVAEAWAKGEAEGRKAAMLERDAQDNQRRSLQLSLQALDQAGIDALAAELAETVKALCAQTISDYSPDPARLLERCRDAARAMGTGIGECALHLNPADIALIEAEAIDQWRVVEDEGIERGGLRFEGPDGATSDRPEDWRRAIASALNP